MSTDNQAIVTDLRNCSVDSKSRNVDWSELLGEDLEGWEALALEECGECGEEVIVSSRMGQDQHRYAAPTCTVPELRNGDAYKCHDCGHEIAVNLNELGETECPECSEPIVPGEEYETSCMGTIGYFEGPMMNHFYPCELVGLCTEDAARAIAHLPLCVVTFESGETGFALTGGGMDLSWEICDAYISCGYLPPLQYCDLPDMAGQSKHPRCQLILAACMRSAEIAEGWARRRGESLARMAQRYKESAA